MDFTVGEAEVEAAGLAASLLGALGAASAAGPAGDAEGRLADMDNSLWKELGQAGLLSLAVPAAHGGDGLGVQATAAVLTEVGRHAARIPALATLALGVLPVATCADTQVQRLLLRGVAAGETILTAAIREPSRPMPARPRTTANSAGNGTTVSGVKVGVPYAAAARWILVPASTQSGDPVVVVVEPDADGLSCQRTPSSSGLPEYTLRLVDSPALAVLDGCRVGDLYQFAIAGACAVADGVLASALDLTTAHVRTREQFGRPLATFQAVAHQIADVYAAARTLHLISVSACWQLDVDRTAAERDVDVAAYWLAEYGPPALRTCHHLHGGLGMDVTYPLPRYSALMTDLAAFVGGAADRLDRLCALEAAGA
jgi:alkylation response protein AidB-like acyl-CoA dehydrogenase